MVLDPQIERTAAQVVAMLQLDDAIEEIGPLLFQQIEDCETIAAAGPDSGQMFVALALPLANNLIHHAAAWWAVEQASHWVRENWPRTLPSQDPVTTLAALTLIHLVALGSRKFGQSEDPLKKEIWSRIRERVTEFAQTPAAA